MILNKKFLAFISILLSCSLLFLNACKDDDAAATPDNFVYIQGVALSEGSDGLTSFAFKLNSTIVLDRDVTVNFETKDGTAIGGEDFELKSGTATIPAGSREALLNIEVIGDTIIEEDETFEVVISNATHAEISGDVATGKINNDDFPVVVEDNGYTTPLSYPGYTLVWSEEFNGSTLNEEDWNYETGNSGWGNNESQNYTSGTNNAFLENGKLIIEAREESSNGSDYSSARITTQGKQFFKYGRIDIRAKLPQGQGIWPALWMLGESFSSVGWPACGEIDIMEIIGSEPATVHGTVHWDNAGNYASYGDKLTLDEGVFADEFHVFTIIWDNTAIRWYMDDILYNTIDITPSNLSEFRNTFFFIFNVAVGGNWPGYPDNTTVFPQRMEVDYVRVFQE